MPKKKPETKFVWERIRDHLKPLDAKRIEGTPGFPDVEMIGCLLELKYAPAWPVRETTHLKLNSLKDDPRGKRQRNFWRRRVRKGGRCFVLLRVANDWLLFRGVDAAEKLCYSTKSELMHAAVRVWSGRLKGDELCQILRHEPMSD